MRSVPRCAHQRMDQPGNIVRPSLDTLAHAIGQNNIRMLVQARQEPSLALGACYRFFGSELFAETLRQIQSERSVEPRSEVREDLEQIT